MANRYPLIANSSANQIQELASSDNIDLTDNSIVGVVGVNASGIITATSFSGSGASLTGIAATDNIITSTASTMADINSTGIITATTFVGAVTGNVTGNASGSSGSCTGNSAGLTGSPNITINNLVGVAATFTGEVTYEDVTNIDSVGIVTARGGLEIGAAGVGGTITAVGNAEFVGIVSDSKGNVRNIPASTNSTIGAADAGKHISITAGITINASTDFAIGDAVTIFNNQGDGNDETITATGITLYLASDATEGGNRTLAGRGVATILCVATDTYVITGAGLS